MTYTAVILRDQSYLLSIRKEYKPLRKNIIDEFKLHCMKNFYQKFLEIYKKFLCFSVKIFIKISQKNYVNDCDLLCCIFSEMNRPI